jgi:hypothetical protein
MTDKPSSDDLQQFSSDVSRRRLITAAATLAVARTISPAAAQLTDRSPNMPDNIRFSNPDTIQKPPGLRWPRLSEQFFRVDKWSLCRG